MKDSREVTLGLSSTMCLYSTCARVHSSTPIVFGYSIEVNCNGCDEGCFYLED